MSNEGSLLRLFNYEGFTLEMLLEFLYKREEDGVISYLINKLYDYPACDIEFYIPQIVNMYFCKPKCGEIERLLLRNSIDSHAFAITLHHNILAFAEDCKAEFKEKVQSFIENLDMTIVNAALPKQTSEKPPPHFYNLPSDFTELDGFNRKTIRSQYYTYQLKIINLICKISVGLNQIPLEERDKKLQFWLESVEDTLSDTRKIYRNHPEPVRRLFRGPIINFKFHHLEDKDEMQIVRVHNIKSMCFCTKARVPYKIIYETISLKEEGLNDSSSVHVINDEAIEEMNTVNVEQINKLVHKETRFEGYNEYVEEAEKNPGELVPQRLSLNENTESTSESIWGESWEDMEKKIRENSPWGNYSSWKIRGIIVKGLDDLRQEYLAMQFIMKIKKIWEEALLSIYIRSYEIEIISNYMGMIEYIPNTLSLHSIKKTYKNYTTLQDFFLENWPNTYEEAQRNFIQSMAGYSLICYVLNIKDRHNANILLDSLGHIIHIDFGFFLTISPGGNIGFESAPFKLTGEMIEVMGGIDGEMFGYFKILLLQGFLELRKHADELLLILKMMGPENNLPCLREFDRAENELRKRLKLAYTDEKCFQFIEDLVNAAQNNWRTLKYDDFQYLTNGIL